MHIKRLAILLLCLIFVLSPVMECYAAINDDILWQPLNSEHELVEAFQAYCKSRDLTIEGSVSDAVTTATTGTFNGLCNKLGVDITGFQAEIKKSVDSNGVTRFLFTNTGIGTMNRIFGQFLQDNELEVGDSVPEDRPKYIYDGKMDPESKALIWIVNSSYSDDQPFPSPRFVYRGSFYYYNGDALKRLSDQNSNQVTYIDLPIDINNNFKVAVKYYSYLTGRIEVSNYSNNYNNRVVWGAQSASTTVYGSESGLIILYDQYNGNYYYGSYSRFNSSNVVKEGYSTNGSINKYNYQPTNVNVYITTNNNTINNNNYEGDTIINEYGTPSDPNEPEEPDDPIGGTPPNWDVGGGDGTITDPDGNNWNINFPDFELPDLNIDWSINGLGNKFPFSIPFDLVALVTVLNAEPEAPRFQGTVNFGFTTWDYDINLQSFDTVASVCRIAELLLLVFGLIMVTRSIIKG